MAVYIRNKPVKLSHIYNSDTTDNKVDFLLTKVNMKHKTEHEIVIVPPYIFGTQDLELFVDQEAPDWAEGITVWDEQQGDLTHKLVIDDADVNLAAEGDYDLIYSAEDFEGNETEVTVNVNVSYEVFNITYNLDGGENHQDNPDTFIVTDLDINLGAPTKEFHTFVAWHDSEALDSVITEVTTAEDTELWAEFTLDEHTVTLELNGGATEDYTEPYEVDAGTTYGDILALITDPTLAENTFDGWFTDVGLETAVDPTDVLEANVTFYAKFTPTGE